MTWPVYGHAEGAPQPQPALLVVPLRPPTMGEQWRTYTSAENDSLYLDVTAGNRSLVTMATVAECVLLHVDENGDLVAIEVMNLSQRGGLQVDDLDADPDASRPAMFTQIERPPVRAGRAQPPQATLPEPN